MYHMLRLVLQCHRALKQDIFPRFLMVIQFRGQDYIVAVAK